MTSIEDLSRRLTQVREEREQTAARLDGEAIQIAQALRDSGLTIVAISKLAGVSRQTIYSWTDPK